MFPYNTSQRPQHDATARPEAHAGVPYHYSPQAAPQRQATGQQVQGAPGQQFYPQQYQQQYYQQDPSKATPTAQGTPSAGTQQTAGAAATSQPQMQMGEPYMQHVVPAMSYPGIYQAQGQQHVQGQPQDYPYYRQNDYVFMVPHAAPMQQVQGQPSQMVSQTVTDPTGQAAPPGIKPKVSTTLWEDEGTLCFQVEARGICVARREDNDMINGTKLLNVAGMTRGRRDGLLKGERNRHVVKAGAMHLKGVWIPYDRALDFANKERIIDLLYPLFVTDIKSVLYHPNQREGQQGQQSQQTPQPQPAQTQPQVSQQTPQPAPSQITPQVSQAQPQPTTAAPTDEKKEKGEYYQQQYYYPQSGQDFRGYQQGQPQYYAGEPQADQAQFKEEEQS